MDRQLRASYLVVGLIALIMAIGAGRADAQFIESLYPNFFSTQNPGQLGLTMFAGGYVSDKYGVTQEGFQFEQSITPYVGFFGRVTGYQLYMGEGFDSPLEPGTGHSARFNFARLQGGLDFEIYPGTTVYLSYGHDVGDSDANVFEADFSSWIMPHSRHPLNASFSTVYDNQNGVTATAVDFQDLVASTENYMFFAGAGGAFYLGGFIHGGAGQGGPDLGVYYRPWRVGVSAQAGYGSAHQYGQIAIYKQINWLE